MSHLRWSTIDKNSKQALQTSQENHINILRKTHSWCQQVKLNSATQTPNTKQCWPTWYHNNIWERYSYQLKKTRKNNGWKWTKTLNFPQTFSPSLQCLKHILFTYLIYDYINFIWPNQKQLIKSGTYWIQLAKTSKNWLKINKTLNFWLTFSPPHQFFK